MRIRTLALVAMAVWTLTVALPAHAQSSGRTWRIGLLSLVAQDQEQSRSWLAAFRDGLRALGYVEGENLVLEQRYAAGRIDRLPALAAELVRLKVDVLVTAPAGSARAARKVTSAIPIVFMGEPDPVGTGLVASLARPGGNVTGLADAHGDLVPKRLGLLQQVVPSIARVGVLWNPSNASTAPQ
ncbi:MAG TPA: ABC transporter substrate-binding protein, partial [Methylomirabilota bacterium]